MDTLAQRCDKGHTQIRHDHITFGQQSPAT